MGAVNMNLRETHSIGGNTKEWMVSHRACPALSRYNIVLTGISEAKHGFEFNRLTPDMSQLLACVSGRGDVLIGGAWKPCTEGLAYLTPPNVTHAYHALKDETWHLCWVSFGEGGRRAPIVSSPQPVLVRLDPRPLLAAIQGLYWESVGSNEPAVIHHCVELIQLFVSRATQPWQTDDRLWRLWEKVDANLNHPWTLRELARLACMSGEHLRRLCHKQTERSPVEQVTFLRMRRAATLLSSTPHKIESISHTVGYENSFAFSTAFKRWMGRSPSEYRAAGDR
jgi:AraC-like DNA-binding protein